MRLLPIIGLVAVAGMFSAGPAAAQQAETYPWCSQTSGIGTECTHPSLSECRFDVQGIGGLCEKNKAFQQNGSEQDRGAVGGEAPGPQ